MIDINLNGCLSHHQALLSRRWRRSRLGADHQHRLDGGGRRLSASFRLLCRQGRPCSGSPAASRSKERPHGISANAINPGSVGTEMMRLGSLRRIAQGGQGTTVEENFAVIAGAMPQKRLIPAEEVAALALHLCRDEAFGITGEALTVAGGALW